MAQTTLRRRLDRAYAVTAADPPSYYFGFGIDSGSVFAVLTNRGELETDRGSETYTGDSDVLVPIARDAGETVGDGSVAWRVWPDGLAVWDPDAETVHTWTGTSVGAITDPQYVDGYLYWWTASDETSGASSCTVKLMRARCNLTSVTQVESQSVALAPNLGSWQNGVIAASETSARATFAYEDPNPDGTWFVDVVADVGGGDFDSSDSAIPTASSGDRCASSAVGSLSLSIFDGEVSTIGTGLGDSPTALWPTSEGWVPEVGGFSTVSMSADGTEAAAVSNPGVGEGLVVRAPTSGSFTTPTETFNFSEELDPWPSVMVPQPEAE